MLGLRGQQLSGRRVNPIVDAHSVMGVLLRLSSSNETTEVPMTSPEDDSDQETSQDPRVDTKASPRQDVTNLITGNVTGTVIQIGQFVSE